MIGDNKPDPPPKLDTDWLFLAQASSLTWSSSGRLTLPDGRIAFAYLSTSAGLSLGLSTAAHPDCIEAVFTEDAAACALSGDVVGEGVRVAGTDYVFLIANDEGAVTVEAVPA